jgi:hypothetical protein
MCVGFPEWTAQLSTWKTTGRDSFDACAIAFKTAQFTQFLRQVWRHTVKSLGVTESVQRPLYIRTTHVRRAGVKSANFPNPNIRDKYISW